MAVPHVSIEDGLLRLYDQLSEEDRLIFAAMLVAGSRATDPANEPEVEGFGVHHRRGLAPDLDSLSDVSQLEQMRMQQMMERRSKAHGALTNVMAKLDLVGDQITPNLK